MTAQKDSQAERVGEILERSLKRTDLSARLTEYGVWPIWNDIVGPTVARHAQPERIRHGTLFIKVSSPIWMQQLQYMKEMIAEKLNQSLRKDVVKNIFFFVGKLEPESVESGAKEPSSAIPASESKLDDVDLSSVKDPEIRRALKRLFGAYSRRRSDK